jgi:hypothetical protein
MNIHLKKTSQANKIDIAQPNFTILLSHKFAQDTYCDFVTMS